MTTCLPPIADLGNIFGPDTIVVAGVQRALVVGVVGLVVSLVRRSRADGGSGRRNGAATQARLRQLDALRGAGMITAAEYAEQRRRILDEL